YLGRKRELYAPLSAPPATGWAPGLAASPLLDPHCGKPAPLEEILRAASREYVHHSRDHAGPAGLMARAEARPIVALEVLVEQGPAPPVRVLLELPSASVHRPPPLLVSQEDAPQPPRDFLGHLIQIHPLARASRTFDGKRITVVHVIHQ